MSNIQLLLRLTAAIAQVRVLFTLSWKLPFWLKIHCFTLNWKNTLFMIGSAETYGKMFQLDHWELFFYLLHMSQMIPSLNTVSKKSECWNHLSIQNALGDHHHHLLLILEEQASTICLWFTFSSQSFNIW